MLTDHQAGRGRAAENHEYGLSTGVCLSKKVMEMTFVVPVIGYLVIAIGVIVLAVPGRFKGLLDRLVTTKKLYIAVLLRVVFGVLFLLAAAETRWPMFVTIMGVFFIFAGVLVPQLGKARIKALAQWWIDRGNTVIRLWALIAMALGAVTVYAAG